MEPYGQETWPVQGQLTSCHLHCGCVDASACVSTVHLALMQTCFAAHAWQRWVDISGLHRSRGVLDCHVCDIFMCYVGFASLSHKWSLFAYFFLLYQVPQSSSLLNINGNASAKVSFQVLETGYLWSTSVSSLLVSDLPFFPLFLFICLSAVYLFQIFISYPPNYWGAQGGLQKFITL